VIASIVLGAVTLRQHMIDDRIETPRTASDAAVSPARDLAAQVTAGRLTQAQAESLHSVASASEGLTASIREISDRWLSH